MPFLSIVIPTYNAARTLKSALQSVLVQTCEDFEILIVDGLSSDDTLSVAQELRDNRIKILSEKDKGTYDAMNKGMATATGEWIYFMGSDDVLYDNTVLERIKGEVELKRVNVLYGNVKIIGDASWAKDGDIYDGPFTTEKLLRKNICHQAVFYKVSFLKQIGLYNLDYRVCADWDYNLRAWAWEPFYYTDIIIAGFNAGGISTTVEDHAFVKDYLKNVLSYFKYSVFDKRINSPTFPGYPALVKLQRQQNYFRYLYTRIIGRL